MNDHLRQEIQEVLDAEATDRLSVEEIGFLESFSNHMEAGKTANASQLKWFYSIRDRVLGR